MREQNVGHVAADQRFEAGEHERPAAVRLALALIVHADQIERAAPPAQLGALMAKQLHSKTAEESGGLRLGAGIDFVVAVASPNAHGGAEPRKLGDAVLERVSSPS